MCRRKPTVGLPVCDDPGFARGLQRLPVLGRILIRPIISLTLSHPPFAGARQRVYMSATLGEAGELERIIGIPQITRLPLPAGWEKQGSGRRFIVFPGHSLDPDQASAIALNAAREAGRVLVLCRDHQAVDEAKTLFTTLGVPILEARDIEASLVPFTSIPAGLLILGQPIRTASISRTRRAGFLSSGARLVGSISRSVFS